MICTNIIYYYKNKKGQSRKTTHAGTVKVVVIFEIAKCVLHKRRNDAAALATTL